MEEMITLGSKVRDKITGFEGLATARSIHLHGCDRYWIQPGIDKDGKMRDGSWFDVMTIEVLKEPKEQPKARKTGGFPSRIK